MKTIITLFLSFIALLYVSAGQTFIEKYNEADKLYESKKYNEAIIAAEQALAIAETEFTKESKSYATTLQLLGFIYRKKDDNLRAIEYFSKEKDIKKKVYGDTSLTYSKALNNIGSLLFDQGKIFEAEPLMLEALSIKRRTVGENDSSYAYTAHNLGVIYLQMGNYSEAEKYLKHALSIRERLNGENSDKTATTLKQLGLLYNNLANYSESIRYYDRSYKSFKNVYGEESADAASTMFQLALSYIALGDENQGKELLKKSQSIQQKLQGENNPEYLKALNNLGMVEWSLKKYDSAESIFEKVKEGVDKKFGNGHPLYSSALNSLGIINWQKGNLEKAGMNFKEAMYIREQVQGKNHPDYTTTLHNYAGVLKEMGRFPEAEKIYKEVFQQYLNQISTYFPFLSEKEKTRFYSNIQDRFNFFYIYAVTRANDNPELISDMYNYRLATKGILLNSIRKIRKKIQQGSTSLVEKYDKWRDIKEELSRIYGLTKAEIASKITYIEDLEGKANQLEKELSSESSDFSTGFAPKNLKWQDVQKALNHDEAAVEIIRFNMFEKNWLDTVYYAVMIVTKETKNNPELIVLKNGYSLEQYYIRNYLNSIKFTINDNDSYNAFWAKIDKALGDKKKIYVSLDGVYNKINLSTLRLKDSTYVVDKRNMIVISNSADLIGKNNDKKSNNNIAYLFGDPKYTLNRDEILQLQPDAEIVTTNSQNLFSPPSLYQIPDLPGTKIEVSNIKDMLTDKTWDIRDFEGIDASEKNFKNIRKSRLIHLATHGYFLPQPKESERRIFGVDLDRAINDPMLRSGLLFAGATNSLASQNPNIERENGIMTAYEVSSLDLDNIDLLVLSACETGLGEIKNGEGVYGLQRSFQIAGVNKMIMSLWKVNDLTTQELMTSFYKYWLGGQELDEAFHNAQRELRDIYDSPYFWGAFIMVGN